MKPKKQKKITQLQLHKNFSKKLNFPKSIIPMNRKCIMFTLLLKFSEKNLKLVEEGREFYLSVLTYENTKTH